MMSNLETSMIRQVLTGDGNVELLQQSRVVFVRSTFRIDSYSFSRV